MSNYTEIIKILLSDSSEISSDEYYRKALIQGTLLVEHPTQKVPRILFPVMSSSSHTTTSSPASSTQVRDSTKFGYKAFIRDMFLLAVPWAQSALHSWNATIKDAKEMREVQQTLADQNFEDDKDLDPEQEKPSHWYDFILDGSSLLMFLVIMIGVIVAVILVKKSQEKKDNGNDAALSEMDKLEAMMGETEDDDEQPSKPKPQNPDN